MTQAFFDTAIRKLSNDLGKTKFNIDINSYENEELIPKIRGGWLSSVYVNDTNISITIIVRGYTFAYLASDLDGDELEQIFEEVYYHFVNEEELGSVEEYLRGVKKE